MLTNKVKERKSSLFILCIAVALLQSLSLCIGIADIDAASDYPSRSIKIIVTFSPGGGADTFHRIIVDKLSSVLGQQVAIENKPGGGGMVGAYAAMSAKPDGYTLLSVTPPLILVPLTDKNIKFDLMKSFAPVTLGADSPTLFTVKKDSRWLTVNDVIAEAKKNPGKLTCSTSGPFGTPHFALEIFKMNTGTDIIHVPMDGQGPAATSVLGGHTDFNLPELGLSFKYLEAGSLRPLMIMSKKRHNAIPNVPTSVELGYPDLISSSWQAVAVPAGTPQAIIERLEKAYKETLNDKEIIKKLEKIGYLIENLNAKETAEYWRTFQEQRKKVVERLSAIK